MTVVFSITEERQRRAAEFCRRHRHFETSEAMDDLAAEFEKLAREVRAQALKDAAEWCQNVGAREPNRERAGVAFHCLNVINARSMDRP
jgi:hypothetical protein